MLKFFHFPLSLYCSKVTWLLEHAAIPHTPILVDLAKGEHKTVCSAHGNYTGKVPFIVDGHLTLAESNAILRYLCDSRKLHHFFPVELKLRAEVDQWMEYLTQHVCEPISDLIWYRYYAAKFSRPSDPQAIAHAELTLFNNLPRVEEHLSGRNYLVTHEPTLADICFIPFVITSWKGKVDLQNYPNIARWQNNMLQGEIAKKLARLIND